MTNFSSAGMSIGGLDIPIVKISNNIEEVTSWQKPIIIIIGRQHTGETHSSFILHGFINFMLTKNLLCHKLRENYEVWVLPIVNPDGVVVGNYRNNL